MGKAVIIGSGVNALGVIHDCVGAGLAVICISTEKSDPASFSRHILKRIKAVSPLDDNENLLKILDANKKDWEGALLIPTDDASAVFVSKNRALDLSPRNIFLDEDLVVILKSHLESMEKAVFILDLVDGNG